MWFRVCLMGCLFLSGCHFSPEATPPQLVHPVSLEAAEGTFSNLPASTAPRPADSFPRLAPMLLGEAGLDPAIRVVRIGVEGAEVTVTALADDGGVLAERVFKEGADFELGDGRLTLRSDLTVVGAEPQALVVAVSHQRLALALTTEGDIAAFESDSFAGLAFLLVPMAGTEERFWVFQRLE